MFFQAHGLRSTILWWLSVFAASHLASGSAIQLDQFVGGPERSLDAAAAAGITAASLLPQALRPRMWCWERLNPALALHCLAATLPVCSAVLAGALVAGAHRAAGPAGIPTPGLVLNAVVLAALADSARCLLGPRVAGPLCIATYLGAAALGQHSPRARPAMAQIAAGPGDDPSWILAGAVLASAAVLSATTLGRLSARR